MRYLNFPGERPNIQLPFALVLAILLTNWMSLKPAKDSATNFGWVKGFSIIMLTVCAGAIYVNAMVYTSSKAQYITDNDFAAIDNIPNALPKLKFEEVKNMFPSIPNIGENSETIGYKKARYLHKEKLYKEAIQLLDSVHKQSPNIIYDDYLKCNIYLEEKKLDSAYKYGKKAFYAKPRQYYYFRMATYLAMVHKDNREVEKLFKTYDSYRQDQQSYSYNTQALYYSDFDKAKLSKIVGDGLKKYPEIRPWSS